MSRPPLPEQISLWFCFLLLLAYLAVLAPVNVRNNRPLPSGVADLLAPDIQGHPHKDHNRRDGRHDAVCILISRLGDPSIGVERQQEPEERLEAHNGECDLACYGSVGVDDVDKADVGSLDGCEVYCSVSLVC